MSVGRKYFAMNPSEPGAPGRETSFDEFHGTAYRCVRQLDAGGMGEVFLVVHRQTSRELVAKMIPRSLANDARRRELMRVEAQSLGLLDHPNIVKITGFERSRSGRLFLVMEYLRGRTLAEELRRRGRLSVLEAVAFCGEILSALAAVHALGIVHRDIKPDNLFVCEDLHGQRFIKLLDFGLARVMPESTALKPLPEELATRRGALVGTPRFASPEAALGEPVDPRGDLYAVALVLYLMLVGRGPFDHLKSDAQVLSAHAAVPPEPPSQFAEDPVPPELDELVLKSLSKDPGERYQSAVALLEKLGEIYELLQRPPGWLVTTAFFASRAAGTTPAEARAEAAAGTPTPLPEGFRSGVHPSGPRFISVAADELAPLPEAAPSPDEGSTPDTDDRAAGEAPPLAEGQLLTVEERREQRWTALLPHPELSPATVVIAVLAGLLLAAFAAVGLVVVLRGD